MNSNALKNVEAMVALLQMMWHHQTGELLPLRSH
jgi:hypothetical protein